MCIQSAQNCFSQVHGALTKWIDERGDHMVCQTSTEIQQKAVEMRIKSSSGLKPAVPCKFGRHGGSYKKKRRNSEFVSRLPQNVDSQSASAKMTPRGQSFEKIKAKGWLKKVAYDPSCIWNEDEPRIFRNFATMGQCDWVRKSRKVVARRRGWQRKHITSILAGNAQGQSTQPALLWNNKKNQR